jgi:hypothetical protein
VDPSQHLGAPFKYLSIVWRMAPRSRPGGDDHDARAVDPDLRSAAGEVLRDESAFLEAEPRQELAAFRGFEDFVRNDFLPWAAVEADRLSAAVPRSATATEAIAREVEASYADRFRPTVRALAPELAGRGCLNRGDAARLREAETASEILALGPVLRAALQKFKALVRRGADDDAGDPRTRSDDGLLQLPYEGH